MPKWNTAEIIEINDVTPTVKQFFLKPKELITWKAGQFITIDLPISDKRTKRWRSYSIANGPGQELIELCIVKVPDGLATSYLWQESKVGHEIQFKEPAGTFVLPNNLDREVIMLCTGTGIAPFRSMIQEAIVSNPTFKHIHLIFGAREESDILYRNELESYALSYPNFKYDIALSRQDDWNGYKGYIHQVYQYHYSVPTEDRLFMICGWSKMIDEAVANLFVKLKYNKSQISYELYG